MAYCNATSSARQAARYSASGGTYVYGPERLGEFRGYLGGWAFMVGSRRRRGQPVLARIRIALVA